MSVQTRRAIVLGGGGSKGAYEVGVWQALHELGMDWQVVTGTSVGALNGALMAMGKLDEALAMWNNLDNTQVMTDIPALSDESGGGLRSVYRAFMNQMLRGGGVDISPLEEKVRALIDEDQLRSGTVELGIVTVEFPALRPVQWFVPDMPQGQVADYLLASAACFPAFRPREIDGVSFIDGGYTDNIPVDLALRASAPVDEIIAVDVEGIGVVRQLPKDVPVTTLRCHWNLGNILIFDPDICRRNIRLGYLDTMKTFGSYGGEAYAFAPGEVAKLEQRHLTDMAAGCMVLLDALSEQRGQLGELLAERILSAVTHRHNLCCEEPDLRQMLLASAELAGELLGLSPTELYTADNFDDAVMAGIGRITAESAGIINALSQSKTPNLTRLVRHWKSEQLLAICSFVVHRILQGDTRIAPTLLAAVMPREFLASLYIEALLY